ncbi:hypothetical protein P4U44_04415 [Alkalihalobacillus alcalophilus]|nr:hypothetical protein [Alkalihalobacillus alcalophilus]MED1561160.1 hypothetical protein [Alkalihalobacillus alcalophilus]
MDIKPTLSADDKMNDILDKTEKQGKELSKMDIKPTLSADDKMKDILNKTEKQGENLSKMDIKPTLSVKDDLSARVQNSERKLRRLNSQRANPIISAYDRATGVLRRITQYMGRHILGARMLTIVASDRATPVMQRVASYARRILARGYNVTVRAIDIATKTVGRIASFAKSAIPRYRDFTIRAIDGASRMIGTIKRALFSIPTLITVALTVVGVGKLSDATVGAAMNFEQYEVSMRHWLDGNVEKAKELVGWMGQFADTTPFSTPDLFPALASGVGITGGDVTEAQRMLKIAADMAALTPGRTVSDAMDALGNSQMGNFEMMKGFGMRILKEDYDAMGGWSGFLDKVESNFLDGAKKLSETSAGILATLKGYRSSIMRSMGEGFLDPMKPRLDAINQWLANNQETWGRWKNTVKTMGEEASEWLFGSLEKGFSYIRDNYLENDTFKNLDFGGKVSFIMDDLKVWWEKSGRPVAEEIGIFLGKTIYKGITLGMKEGIKGIGASWLNFFQEPSLESFGGASVATMIGASIASLVLTPLLKGLSLLGKGAKGIWDVGKKAAGLFKGGKGPKTPTPKQPKLPKSPPVYTQPWFNRGEPLKQNKPNARDASRLSGVLSNLGKTAQRIPVIGGALGGLTALASGLKGWKTPKQPPAYTQPWFNRGETIKANVPNAKDPSRLSKLFSGIGQAGKRVPILGTALSSLAIATAPKGEKAGAVGAVGGGLAGAAAGAAVGSVIPGVGTAIGGIVGGIAGSLGGEAIGDWFSDNWDSIKAGAASAGTWVADEFGKAVDWTKDAWSSTSDWFAKSVWEPVSEGGKNVGKWVGENFESAKEAISSTLFSGDWWSSQWDSVKGWTSSKLSDTAAWWEGIKQTASDTLFSADWWLENAGFVYGYLEGTIFNGQWWGRQWDSVKKMAEGTIFDGAWWSQKWDATVDWASQKWDSAVAIWETVATTFAETVFNGAWWQGHWDSVLGWASQKWDSAVAIWETVATTFAETVFSAEWWQGHWDSVLGWASEKWDSAVAIWEAVATVFAETVFSAEWWQGHWDSVLGWASEKWDSAVVIWEAVATAFAETVFSAEWWQGHWDSVLGWASEKWDSAVVIWEAVATAFAETVFSAEWWQGHWDSVLDWASQKWDSAVEIWENVKTSIGSTLFNSEWWLGKWDDVVGWGKSKLEGLSTWASGLWEKVSSPFQSGRERGNQAATAYANGGYINRPHLGLVGEAGPEMIIPLSSGRRARALSLWEETGKHLGVSAYANGGLVGGMREKPVNLYRSYEAYQAPTGTDGDTVHYNNVSRNNELTVNVGGVNVTVQVGEKVDYEKIAEECGWRIANAVKKALENR